ncbi:MAG TPA: two-component regulator propeller domain-containing protein, partial [Flavisolibacter sp.]|nr:two-component regulator propeller domain-containing protein [Flavisolibacter sp.]
LYNADDPEIASVQIKTLYFDDKGMLWIGTAKKGLLKVDIANGAATVYPLNDRHHAAYAPALQKTYNSVYAIRQDEHKVFLLATHDGLYRLPNAASMPSSVRPAPVKSYTYRKDLYNDMVIEGDSIWLSAWGGGLTCFWPKNGRWKNYLPDPDNFGKGTTNIINNIGKRNKEELWICSGDKGLGIFNKRSKRFYFFRDHEHSPDLPDNEVYGLTVDKDGNAWLLHNRRLLKVTSKDSRFYFTDVGVTYTDNQNNFEINDFWEDESIRLIATGYADGLHVLNKQTGRQSILKIGTLPKEELTVHVRQIFKDSHNHLWILTRDFLYYYDRLKNALIRPPQPPLYSRDSLTNGFLQMTEDRTGKLWIATRRNGVFVWDGEGGAFERYANDAPGKRRLPFNFINALAVDKRGRVWLAGVEGVLGYVSPESGAFINLPAGFGQTAKMPGNKGYTLYADDDGNIWAGTATGLYFFTCANEQPSLKRIINGNNGLVSELVFDVLTDKQRNLWLLSDAGLSHLPQGSNLALSYGEADGIKKGAAIKLLRTASDTVLLLGYGGYYRFAPSQLSTPAPPRPLVITAMQVNGLPFYPAEHRQMDGVIQLGAQQNFFSFEFAALNFIHPEKQQYAYMLEGIDKNWILSGSRRFVSYANVPGGRYTFKVKTLENGINGKENVLSIPLYIATPFYKTIAFFVLLAFAIAGVLYAAHRSHLAHQNKVSGLETKAYRLEKEKALVMYEGLKQQLNPHFLFNSLTSLNSLILKDPQTARKFLEGLSSTYRYILKSRESEVVELSKELAFAESYIQLQTTRFGEALRVNIRIDDEYTACKIVPVTLQNLIENATKHNVLDKESPLHVDIYTEAGYIIVRNNLQKKSIVETSNKQGLRSLKTLYGYLTDQPLLIEERVDAFIVRIPLLP